MQLIKISLQLLCLGVFIANCASPEKESTIETAASTESSVADLIRNPATLDGDIDTSNLAKISFEEETFDFGTVDEGAVVVHKFHFENTGDIPLIISDVRSTCGCTIADWPQNPIAPGGKETIEVKFDTKKKTGHQGKPIFITANTYPAKHQIVLKGFVDENPS